MDPGPEPRLEHLRRLPNRPVQPAEEPGGHSPEQRRERGAGDVVPWLPDGDILPAVVPTLAVEGFLHEGGEGEGALGADEGLEAEGGGHGRRISFQTHGEPRYSCCSRIRSNSATASKSLGRPASLLA